MTNQAKKTQDKQQTRREFLHGERVAFSYIRFSSKKQELGDSKRRQHEGAVNWCERNGVRLDKRNFCDLGVSGWKGKNFDEGALGSFLEFAKSDRCPKDCILVVESLDRITRETADEAYDTMKAIVRTGVTVVTLSPERTYDRDSLKDIFRLIEFLVICYRANEESEIKSERVSKAWKQAHTQAALGKGIITKRLPAWLTIANDKIVPIPERKKIVQTMFDWATKNGMGQRAIAKRLNELNIEPWGSKNIESRKNGTPLKWGSAYVRLILSDRRACGDYISTVSEVIPKYYPRIISEEQFAKAKQLTDSRIRFYHSEHQPTVSNLFGGIAFDVDSGCSMVRILKRPHVPPRFIPSDYENGRKKGAKSFRYDLFEESFLVLIRELVVEFGDTNDTTKTEIFRLETEAAKIEKRLAEVQEAMESGGESIVTLQAVAGKLEKQRAEIAKELQLLRAASSEASGGIAGAASLIEKMMGAAKPERAEIRWRVRQAIRQLVRRIDCKLTADGWISRLDTTITFYTGEKKQLSLATKRGELLYALANEGSKLIGHGVDRLKAISAAIRTGDIEQATKLLEQAKSDGFGKAFAGSLIAR